jgi:hypothetical protein
MISWIKKKLNIIRKVELEWDHFSWWEGHTDISVRTSERDTNGCCSYQKLEFDEEGKKIMDNLCKWIDRNLK